MRCLVAASGVAAVEPLINAVGDGPAFTILACLCLCLCPLLAMEWRYGAKWRIARNKRLKMGKSAV